MLDLLEDLLEFLVLNNIFDPEESEVVLLTFVEILCVVVVDPHLFEFVIDNYLALQHGSDEYVASFDQFFEMFVLFNLEVE